jgi:hypothetical protein
MNLTNIAPEQSLFDPYVAAKREKLIEVLRDQDRLEMSHMAEPGKLIYAVGRMLSIGRWPYTKETAKEMWEAYAQRVFNAAVEAGNAEACAVALLCAMAKFAVQCERQRARVAARIEREQKRSPEARSDAAKKAVVTRNRNKAERTMVRDAITGADAAIEAVFQVANTLANAE